MSNEQNAQPTAEDYNVDMGAVLEAMGIDPGMVKADSISVQFLDNKPVLQYSVIRAIPGRALAIALLAGSRMELVREAEPGEDAITGANPVEQPSPVTLAPVPDGQG